ncbi:hypothetical protein [Streptomyces poonensis]|uniref:Uncharacterized protein n=1 Tax=Streptomyces poonensis TaxID=68255 RepID=A0A918QCC5_9ACTN|nr:hypothetical protein [Streptomyces poonensis]GGZ41791.1 hypothetical protein GCM10010365_73220 [Streptomyces poonensis]
MTVTGLLCGLDAVGVCRAGTVVVDGARIHYSGAADQVGSCTTARRVTLSGRVLLRAAVLRGRVFGLLPLTLSTAAVPPVPVPYVRMRDVRAVGRWSRAESAVAQNAGVAPAARRALGCWGR